VIRTIMHIDMNAFFASVEQQSNPALRGKPIAVVGSQKRTIILTSSYEARKFGVKTAMTLYEARLKCPQLQFVPTNNRLYTHVSTQIMQLFGDYTPLVEVFSIDEAFLTFLKMGSERHVVPMSLWIAAPRPSMPTRAGEG